MSGISALGLLYAGGTAPTLKVSESCSLSAAHHLLQLSGHGPRQRPLGLTFRSTNSNNKGARPVPPANTYRRSCISSCGATSAVCSFRESRLIQTSRECLLNYPPDNCSFPLQGAPEVRQIGITAANPDAQNTCSTLTPSKSPPLNFNRVASARDITPRLEQASAVIPRYRLRSRSRPKSPPDLQSHGKPEFTSKTTAKLCCTIPSTGEAAKLLSPSRRPYSHVPVPP